MSDENIDVEKLKQMDASIKSKTRKKYKSLDELEDEYYEEHPEKRPLTSKIKKRMDENKARRDAQREYYKAVYDRERIKAEERGIRRRATTKAKKYEMLPRERVANVILGPPRTSSTKKRQISYPSMQQMQPQQRKQVFSQPDFSSLLGSFGTSSSSTSTKKKKKTYKPPSLDDMLRL